MEPQHSRTDQGREASRADRERRVKRRRKANEEWSLHNVARRSAGASGWMKTLDVVLWR